MTAAAGSTAPLRALLAASLLVGLGARPPPPTSGVSRARGSPTA